MKSSILLSFVLIGLASNASTVALASSEDIGFYCESAPWQYKMQGNPVYVKSVSCEVIEGGFLSGNLVKKAQKICDIAAHDLNLPPLNAIILPSDECHNKSVKKSQALKEQHIDELDLKDLYSQKMWFEVFIDNRINEAPLYRSDGVEQAQWLKIGNDNYCGFPGQGIVFNLNEGKSLTVINLKAGKAVKFDFILSKNNTDTYRQALPVDKSLPEFIDHSMQMDFFNISLYNYKASGKSDVISIPLALMDRLNKKLCVRSMFK
jgi:hypothetical protein